MKNLTLENMILEYIECMACDARELKLFKEVTNYTSSAYKTFFNLGKMGFVPFEDMVKFGAIINDLKLDDSADVCTNRAGKVLYRFNEQSGHFEKAC